MGVPQRTMTLHHRALKHVDGSLSAQDVNAEERWVAKVRALGAAGAWCQVHRVRSAVHNEQR